MTAAEVLSRVAEAYANAASYREVAITRMEVDFGPALMTVATRPRIVEFRRPNRFHVACEWGMDANPFVEAYYGDGASLVAWAPSLKRYQRAGAPRDIAALIGLHPNFSGPGPLPSLPSGLALILGRGGDLLSSAHQSRLLTPVVVPNGRQAYVVEQRRDAGRHTITLWADKQDYRIWRLEARVEPATMVSIEDADGATKLDAEAHSQMQAALQRMRYSYAIEYKEVALNPPLPDSRFVFTPPVEATEGDDLLGAEQPVSAPENSEAPPEADLTDQPAADFTLPTLDGREVTLSDLRGSPVLLIFWASWCEACRSELAQVQKIHEQYGRRGLKVVAVNLAETRDVVAAAAKTGGWTFPVLLLERGTPAAKVIAQVYQVRGIPRTLLIDDTGVVRFDRTGLPLGAGPSLEKELPKIGISATGPRLGWELSVALYRP